MIIAQFVDTDNIGGAETMLVRLSLALKQSGHQVIIFHFGNHYLEDFCEENQIKQVLIPDAKLYRSIFTVQIFSIRFASLLRQHNIDVLHSHLYGPVTGTFLGTSIYSIPHIATLHDVYIVQERIGRGWLLRIAQLFGAKLVAVSNDMNDFYGRYIPRSRHILTIYNGFQRKDEEQSKKQLLLKGKNETTLKIITVGRLIPLKRQKEQIESLCNLLKKYDAELFLVGEGPEQANIIKQIEDLNLQDKVHLLGQKNNVQELLEESDIFVLASSSEGLSCSIIEAMSSGLPCVVSDVGGNSELVQNGTNGLLFKLEQGKELSKNIEKLILDKPLRISMGRAGKEIADTKFSLPQMTELYIENYRSLIK